MKYLTFRVPSIQSEEEFKKLIVLYLDETELLPGALEWKTSHPIANGGANAAPANEVVFNS